MEKGLDSACHIPYSVFDRADGTLDAVDDAHDEVAAPAHRLFAQTEDVVFHAVEAGFHRVQHLCHGGAYPFGETIEHTRDSLLDAVDHIPPQMV